VTYVRRLVFYAAYAVVGSIVGAAIAGATSDWEVTWGGGLRLTAISVGPPIAVAALAPVSPAVQAVVATVVGAGTVLMWALFASSDSSTSGLVFTMGWFVGLPAAGALVVATQWWAGRRE
jgi:hypothetical protein